MHSRRSSAFEDVMDLASKLPWPVSLTLSAVAFIALTLISQHYLAATTVPPKPSDFATPVVNAMYGQTASLARWVITPALMVGAFISWRKGRHRLELLSAATVDSTAIERLSWQDFERLIGQAYRQQGYSVTELGGQGPDGGVDLILVREGRETLVQCKQWRERRVGVRTIRELHGIMAQRHAAAGVVVTLGGYTAEAEAFAEKCGILLHDRKALTALLRDVDSANSDLQPTSPSPTTARACPRCGSTLIRRTARRGPNAGRAFLGCSRYPACREIQSLDA
ncbi:MAG: restriction endonuclease [Gammaproteobacteria bacterium]|nr:restriction endonuclease [Gammaproteobacteria bacterium]